MDRPLVGRSLTGTEPASLVTQEALTGEAEALYELGFKFENAGGRQNCAQAAQYYLKAAAQNHTAAQINLSGLYARGEGLRRDDARSMMWLSKAAHLGDPAAQYTLGLRQNRISMDQELELGGELRIEAYKWLQLAVAQHYPGARTGCDFVTMGMTREGVSEGNRRAAAFVAGDRVSVEQTAL